MIKNRVNRLKKLLIINGPTGEEGEILQVAYAEIVKLGYGIGKVQVDKTGNLMFQVFRDRMPATWSSGYPTPTVLISAHLDTCCSYIDGSRLLTDRNTLKKSEGILGADDRAGVALILNVIEEFGRFNSICNLKVVFTVGEELGQYGAEALDPSFYKGIDFAVSLDRRGCNDIITHSRKYTYDQIGLGEEIARISQRLFPEEENHYRCTEGGISDLRVWSQEAQIPSVNLSIGYEGEHNAGEMLYLDCWHRTHELLKAILIKSPEITRNIRLKRGSDRTQA